MLDSYKKMAHSLMIEADIDDEKMIKYKDKDGESKEMKAGSAKTMEKDHPAKIAYDKMADKGADDSEKDAGGKLGGGDFDRDPDADNIPATDDGDDFDQVSQFSTQTDRFKDDDGYADDDYGDDDDMDDEEKSAESENEKIINDLEKMDLPDGFNLDTPDSEIDGGRYGVITGKDDDPDNELSVNAITGEGGKVEYVINIGSGGTPIYFDSKEEAMEASKKLLDDATIRDAMNGESDPAGVTLADLDDHAKNVLKSDDDESKPIPAAGTKDDEPTHEEIIQYIEDEGYGGDAIGPDGNPTPEAYEDAKEELMAMKKKNEIRVINGVKYRAIKESMKPKKHILKENYDRFFGDK